MVIRHTEIRKNKKRHDKASIKFSTEENTDEEDGVWVLVRPFLSLFTLTSLGDMWRNSLVGFSRTIRELWGLA